MQAFFHDSNEEKIEKKKKNEYKLLKESILKESLVRL